MPFWLSIYRKNYGRAAMALNWRPLWMGKGAITGVVEEVQHPMLNAISKSSSPGVQDAISHGQGHYMLQSSSNSLQ